MRIRLRAVPQPISTIVSPGLRLKLAHQPVAAREIIFAREIVEVPLTAVDAIHQRGVAAASCDWLDQEGLRLA